MINPDSKYSYLLKTRTADKWEKISINRRAGIAVPLFSLYSKSSIGIGEIPDLKLLVDWCKLTGFSIIQLLPLYDTGNNFAPYSSVSSFALDCMYLKLQDIKGVDDKFSDDILTLKKEFSSNKVHVNYKIKKAKTALLWKMFRNSSPVNYEEFESFKNRNKFWLDDYSLFKVLTDKNFTGQWENWTEDEKNYNLKNLRELIDKNKKQLDFYKWLQWQLFEQMALAKKCAKENGILLMGDIPFLVSRNSADVWSHRQYFNLELSAGAPPDMYSAYGQRWGMPTYNWNAIEKDNYEYLKERLKAAEKYYDMYRIDHFIGLFRIWTMKNSPDSGNDAIRGFYDPEDESNWENHGRKIIDMLLDSTSMLPCAEDLGTVPACSGPILLEYGIPGTDCQRFLKKDYNFINPELYRTNSISILSLHDTAFFINWWNYEAGSIEKELFEIICSRNNLSEQDCRSIKNNLFDKGKSGHGRLFWNKNLTPENVRTYLKDFTNSSEELIHLYLYTYEEKKKYLNYLGDITKPVNKSELVYRSLKILSTSNSIFNIQFLNEYLCIEKRLLKKINRRKYRINKPGTTNKNNWSIKLPVSLEKLMKLKINPVLLSMNRKANRMIK